MRLINVHTLKLKEFIGSVPPYAILSHRWGEDEVSLQDLKCGTASGRGYQKIEDFCRLVRQSNSQAIAWAWVDTCCIDKTSSAELSEAINSMWRWYRDARWCAAFLEDVATGDLDFSGYNFSASEEVGRRIQRSAWFTRGWTLQELLAPRHVHFFSQEWTYMGDKSDTYSSTPAFPYPLNPRLQLTRRIHAATSIDPTYLKGSVPLQWASIAQKMSWAADRKTSRPEDTAYSLLGLFGLNMPLIYGEGGAAAFRRLQEQIIQESEDDSIFAFRGGSQSAMADSPARFSGCGNIERVQPLCSKSYSISQQTLHLSCPATEIRPPYHSLSNRTFIVQLNCVEVDPASSCRVQLLGLQQIGASDQYIRKASLVLEVQGLKIAQVTPNLENELWCKVDRMDFRIPLLPLSWHHGHDRMLPRVEFSAGLHNLFFGGTLATDSYDGYGYEQTLVYRDGRLPSSMRMRLHGVPETLTEVQSILSDDVPTTHI